MQNKFLQFLGLAKKSGSLLEGYNKCEEVIKKNKISLLIISTDCSNNTKEKFLKHCSENKINYIEAYSKEDLAVPLGRAEINILGVTNKQMSKKLLELWNEQNNIKSRG